MTSSAKFNALPLLSVKPALDESLDKIGHALEQFFASNGEDQAALKEAIGELHRAYGVLRMLSLDGVMVFCGELEKLLQEFATGGLQPSSMHHEVTQRALLILTYFLGSLADGGSNAALRLFDPYQELLQARGIEAAFAVDLFFPELNVELPRAVVNLPLGPDAPAHIKAARSQYQQALLKWLRKDNTAEALQNMHAAVLAVLPCVPPEGRAFWWVAAGLLDCLIFDGLPPELNANKLLGRVDLRMKSLVEGAQVDERATLNEMLYLVACSHAVSERVEEIKRRYALDEYLPEEPPLPPGETAQVLEQLRELLNSAEEFWEKCALQDEAACGAFAAQAEKMQAKAEQLDRNTLQLLCRQINAAAARTAEPEYRQRIRMDMALALILLDNGIAYYAHLGDSFHEQVRILGQRLHGVAGEVPDVAELVPLHCQMAQREIIPLLTEAMTNNLQHVEQELNVFFANPDKREELTLLVRLLNQVQGCLHMLSLDVAEQLLRNAKQAVNRYAEGGALVPAEMRSTATAISALGAYIHDLTYGQQPDTAQLEQMLQAATAQPSAEAAPAAAKGPGVSATVVAVPMPSPEDNEMLEVFLEEAQEVLGILRTNLDLSQLHPESIEPLVTIRRGFHTLKGSGRMVGLNDLGEVAWAVERAMNKWLQENKPATPGLLQFIADAEALFHAWVDSLRTHSGTMINTTPLVEAAQKVENGEELAEPGVAAKPAAEAEQALAPAEAPAEVGAEEAYTLPSWAEYVGPGAPEAEQPAAAEEFVIPELGALAAPAPEPELLLSLETLLPPTLELTPEPEQAAAEEFVMPELGEIWPQAAAVAEPERPLLPEALLLPTLELAPEPEKVPAAAEEVALPELEEAVPQATPAPEAARPLAFEALLPPTLELAAEPAKAPAPEELLIPELEGALPQAPEVPPAPEAETVTIGKITLSASLFDIATEESASHLSKLQNYLAELLATTPPTVTYDFMRAAHTLAGVNRTLGFVALADLSRALELWLEARVGKVFTLKAEQTALLESTVAMLDAMFLDICNHQEPEAQPELIVRLQADQELLIAGEAPVPQEAVPSLVTTASVAEGAARISLAPAAPAEVAPAEVAPVEVAPVEVAPVEVAPVEVAPVEVAPVEVAPVEVAPAEVAPAEVAPAVTKGIWGTSAQAPAAVTAARTEPEVAALGAPISVEAPPALQPSATEGEQRVRQYVEERAVRDEIDEQLLPIFLEESSDLQPLIGKTLRAWRENPDDMRLSHELQRGLHTLKGSARMAGVMRLGELTHRMEDRVVAGTSKALRTEALWDELENFYDRISNALERLRSGAFELEVPEAAAAEPERPAAGQAVVPEAARPQAVQAQAPQPQAAQAPAAQPLAAARADTPAERAAAATLRVRSETVDRLVNEAGEISVARSRLETELRAFKTGLTDMSDSVIRLRRQLREIEIQAESQMEARVALAKDMAEKFDPLEFDRFSRFQELTRFMGESVHDVQTVQQTLMKNLDEAAAALSAQAYINRELQQSLMSIRMVPFSGISDRLYRIVRQTAKELQKRANLDLKGTEVELDRSVLDRMTAPFEHILRNAVAHGLEGPEERSRNAKSLIGQIQIALSQESNEVVFDIVDDGAGINLDALRRKALEVGLVPPGTQISDEDAMQLIFSSGLSTAAEVTEISGRGVGMDVVRNEITSLGGQISVRTEPGKGTRFTIRLPLTLAVTQVLMTRVGADQYAIPSVMVEQVLHIKSSAMEEAHRAGIVEWQGRAYPLKYLPHLLGDEKHVPENRMHNSILLLHSGEQRVALHVDELLGNQETVVKNIGPQLSRLPGIAGATVLGNGRVVLILNPVALTQPTIVVRKEGVPAAAAPLAEAVPEAMEAPPPLKAVPLVMVVDDSLTVRKVTSRMLTRAGYDVATAKDGVDALEQLTQITPDIVLLDVEMPRMDGFEFTRQIRRDPKLHNLPILMITSRTAEKHRDYALELGVNAYFGKPFQEEELLQQIRAYISKPDR